MKRFKNPNSLPVAPVTWRDPINGHKEEFRSAMQPFSSFLSRVWAYWESNHPEQERPSQEAIENELCGQYPSWACVGEGWHSTARAVSTSTRAKPCGTCGKRR